MSILQAMSLKRRHYSHQISYRLGRYSRLPGKQEDGFSHSITVSIIHRTSASSDCRLEGGDLSGASQPHKHIQLIPIEEDGPPIEKMARSMNLEVVGKVLITALISWLTSSRPSVFSEQTSVRQPRASTTVKSNLCIIR